MLPTYLSEASWAANAEENQIAHKSTILENW